MRALPLARLIGSVLAAGLVTAACHAARPTAAAIPAADSAARHAAASEAETIGSPAQDTRTIGVLPFDVSATDTAVAPLAYGLADLLMTDLSRSAHVRLVDRLRLDAVIRELDLANSGRVDEGTAPRAGLLMGARRLIVGRLTSAPSGAFVIDARITDVPTGAVRPGVSARAPLGSILDAEKALAFELFNDLGIALSPAEIAAVSQRPTANISALLAYSRGVRDEFAGDYKGADAQFGDAIHLDSAFVLARQRQATVRVQEAAGAQIAGGRPGGPHVPGSGRPLPHLALGLVNQVNAPTPSGVGAQVEGPADPSFPLSQLITLFIVIRVP